MRIIKWKASKMEIIEKNEIFFFKGIIVACCDNEIEYKIPYGACDREKKKAYEKAVSEMCERSVWFTVYSMYPKLFPNTKGFSAHIDQKMGCLNSIREYIERKLFEKIKLCLKENRIEDLYKMFSIKRRDNQIIFFYYSKIYNTYFVFIFIKRTYIKEKMEQIGFVVGMGKSRKIFSAYEGSLNEAKLVEYNGIII